jgi:acyl dehydratase
MEKFGNYFEDFSEGQKFEHWPGKTITESDNNLFSLLTMNHHPLHIDANYCKDHYPGKILVVGTLVFSLVVGMSVSDISGKAIANLEYENIKHLKPVFIGDTIYANTIVISKRESNTKPDRGIIYVKTEARNQNEEVVLSFRRRVLVPKFQ